MRQIGELTHIPPHHSIEEQTKRTLFDLIPLLLGFGLFALFGGAAKLLRTWRPGEGWKRRAGSLLASIFAGWMIGLPAYEYYPDRPGILFMLVGAACWGGSEIIDMVTRRLEERVSKALEG